ncbi:glycoside hydrolase family 43 protein [Zunongwangia endophytica]|uniref:Glycoside hydrolase family 43 protein n=1 Tax=Zunongwangia endophytica TaxID=1808945 RepID=A0ABV8HCT5_9FLAO|nr:glycoside hydrolase family 43 protein [Zunongwangia endophytica]MDN3593757.1 glycoside hydrolase family 43 protein [Zunongwangia endophytica]
MSLKLNISGYLLLSVIIATFSSCKNAEVSEQQKTAEGSPSEEITYNNPIVGQRADPWVLKAEDGTYYFIATAPEYDRIEMRAAKTINDLGTAEPKVLWNKHENGVMSHHIWAPELHRIDGKWYIYFAAGQAEDVWKIRMFALSNDSEDPMMGEWKEEGQIATSRDSFSLDATTFEHNGEHYYAWAQAVREEGGTSILLSKMETPTSLKGEEIEITNPEYDWERIGYLVNEGPAVIKRNGKIFMTYSASATDSNYAMGLLWADEDADLMDPESWHKSEEPVFSTNPEVRRFGPGHSSFTVAEDGETDVLIYHARVYEKIRGNSLYDFNRHTRARTFGWDEKGFPDFYQNKAD